MDLVGPWLVKEREMDRLISQEDVCLKMNQVSQFCILTLIYIMRETSRVLSNLRDTHP